MTIDLEQACEQAIQASNDLLSGLRAAGMVVVEVGQMMSQTSEGFTQFLFAHPSPFDQKVRALAWSCESAVALVKGMVQEHPLNTKEMQEVRQKQLAHLGQWEKFADDMVKGAEGRLELWADLEKGLIKKSSKLAL